MSVWQTSSLCEHTHIRFLEPGFHKDIRTRRIAYLTQFSIPALLNSIINKMADEASAILLLICLHEVCRGHGDLWLVHGLVLMLVLMLTQFSQSKLPGKHKHKHKNNELVRFSCAYAYVDPVFTCLGMCLCLCLCASENQALLRFRQNEVYLLTLGRLLGFSS